MQSGGWCPEACPRTRLTGCEIQRRSKQRLLEGDGTTLPRTPPRRAGRRWPRGKPLGRLCPEKTVYGFRHSSKTPATDGKAEVMLEERSRKETWKSQAWPYRTRLGEPRRLRDGDHHQNLEGRGPTRGRAQSRCHLGLGARGGSRNPASSSSGETEVNPATAEQTMLRIALWRRTLSPPPQQEREWSPHRSRTSPHMPHAESRSQSFNGEDVCALVL